MSELPHDGPDGRESKDADIIPLFGRGRERSDENRLDPEDLTPKELTDLLLAPYRHPSSSKLDSAVVARHIRKLLDADLPREAVESLSERDIDWRIAYLKQSVDGLDLSLDTWRRAESDDGVFHRIVTLRRDTGREPELADQRGALEGLINFRLGIKAQQIDTVDTHWHNLLDALTK